MSLKINIIGGVDKLNPGSTLPALKKGLFVELVACGIGKCKVRYII